MHPWVGQEHLSAYSPAKKMCLQCHILKWETRKEKKIAKAWKWVLSVPNMGMPASDNKSALWEKKKIVRCLDKYAYVCNHLVIAYSFATHAHTVSVILFSDMLPAQSFAFLKSFVWSLNYFILLTRASNLLSLVLYKCTCMERPVPSIFILLFFLFCFVEEKKAPHMAISCLVVLTPTSILVIENEKLQTAVL